MKLAVVTLAALALGALSGCGKSPPSPAAPPPAAATTSSPAPAGIEPPSDASAPPPVVAEPSAPDQTNEAKAQKPAHQLSEMDDDTETVDSGATSATPVLSDADSGLNVPEVALFKEGVNYKVVVPAQPTASPPGRVEVVEFFWYGCPHCYDLDPQLESWRQGDKPGAKPAWVDLVRVPATWNDALRLHARLFYTLDALGRLDELHPAVFTEIHVNDDPLDTAEKIGAFLHAHGVDADDFQRTFFSTAVQSQVAQADLLGRRYRVQSVPRIVINGKYWTDVGLAGSPEKLLALVDELATEEHIR